MNNQDVQAVFILLTASPLLFLLFQPWRRALWDLRKATRWQLGVWRDAKFASLLTRDPELTKRAASFDTESLLASCKWPEHTAPATAAIRQELETVLNAGR